uniref:non-specific serine/threonine protein kinase n=1 Tax=Oncorhynchus tshawytscha TaxID=74940 RepID=A0A8C8EYK5_ONCTS
MDLYHVLEMIGEGSFGRVYKGRKKFSGQVVALKFIPKVGRSEKELRNLKREIDIMRGLEHPNIVLLLDSFETEREVVVVTEYAEGELFQILEDDGNLPESQVRDIACQLVSALYYLHSHRILHRDMKPQNILLGKGGVVKLCDFGFARAMSVSTLVLTSIKGTPLYMSPELVEEKPYDHTADLWSLGCILYELHTGAPPFYTNSIFQLVQLIVRDPVKWPDTMSQTCMTFLKGLLTKDPQKRLSWPHILKHPFVADGVLVLSDPVVSSPLTVAASPDLQVLKLQQAVQKAAPHGGEGRLLRKAREQRDKRNRQSSSQISAPVTYRGQISRDYEQGFPSVDVGPRKALRRPETQERGQVRTSLSAVRLHSQDVDSDEEWERLIQQTSVSSGQTIQIIPRLKEKLLTSKTLLLDGILEGACQIRQPLKVLSNLILTSDSEDSHRLRQEVGLPHFLFNLVQDIVENPVVVKVNLVILTSIIILPLFQQGTQTETKVSFTAGPWVYMLYFHRSGLDCSLKCSLSQPRVPLPSGWGFCDGFLSLVLHTLTEHESPPHSASLDPSILRLLWVKVGTSLEKTSARTKFCSSNGLYVFLSLALFVLTRDPYCCVPLFSDSDTNCILTLGHLLTTDCLSRPSDETHGQLWGCDSSVNSLSMLSCHLLCFPFALDLSSETMDRLLQLYHSAGIVSGLLQVIQSVPPSLLELPLSLLCRLLLCDPGRSVPCFTAAARAQGFFSPPSSDPKEDRRDQAPASRVRDQAGHPVSVSRTASSLLSDLLKPESEALWGSAVELFTLLSQVARCSPRSRPSTPHLYLEPAPLHQALAHPDDRVRAAACSLLGNLDPFTPHTPPSTSDPQWTRLQPAILRDIIGCLHDPSTSVRRMACKAVGNWLGLIGKAEFRTRRANGRENSSAPITGDGRGWVAEANWATTELLSLIADPDALTRRHCCAALGNMAAVEGGVASLLEGDVPLLLLQAACTDSQHTVQQAAVATLSLYSQQDALRQALLSLDAREKLRQASQHVAPPQCDYCQIIKLL